MADTLSIPQELVEHIIWEISNEEDEKLRLTTLRACTLVSWSFVDPCQRILFSVVSIREDGTNVENKLRKFLDLLEHNTRLASHVKSLIVALWDTRTTTQNMAGPLESPPVKGRPDILSSILKRLRHVQSLNMSIDGMTNSLHEWSSIDQSRQQTLSDFCALNPLKQVSLRNFHGFPISLIENCYNLTSLSVFEMTWLLGRPHDASIKTTPKLESLYIDGFYTDFLYHLLDQCSCLDTPHFDLSTLRRLELEERMIREPALTKAVGPYVTHLCVHGFLAYTYDNDAPYISLNNWKHLQVLELKSSFHQFSTHGIGLLPLINPGRLGDGEFPELQRVWINTLRITGKWTGCSRKNEMERFRPSAGWKSIDGVLSSPVFPNLRSIEFDLTLSYEVSLTAPRAVEKYLREKVEGNLSDLLPAISRSKSVQVKLGISVISTPVVHRHVLHRHDQ